MKRNAREQELEQAAETAFRLGGMEAVYKLSAEQRRNLPCPLCRGGKVTKLCEVQSFYDADGTVHHTAGQQYTEKCGGCRGEGKVRVSVAHRMLLEIDMIQGVHGGVRMDSTR